MGRESENSDKSEKGEMGRQKFVNVLMNGPLPLMMKILIERCIKTHLLKELARNLLIKYHVSHKFLLSHMTLQITFILMFPKHLTVFHMIPFLKNQTSIYW